MAVDGNDESKATGQPNEAHEQQPNDDSASGPRPPKDADEGFVLEERGTAGIPGARREGCQAARVPVARRQGSCRRARGGERAACGPRIFGGRSADAAAGTQTNGGSSSVRGCDIDRCTARHEEDVRSSRAGLEQSGEISFPDENPEEAAEAVTQKLKDDYPQFFTGDGGPLGRPAGPSGELPEDFNDLTPEQQRNLSDEDFHKHYGAGRKRRKTGRTIFG
jgi:hypothetical protein